MQDSKSMPGFWTASPGQHSAWQCGQYADACSASATALFEVNFIAKRVNAIDS